VVGVERWVFLLGIGSTIVNCFSEVLCVLYESESVCFDLVRG
jgi:hypothetical protein